MSDFLNAKFAILAKCCRIVLDCFCFFAQLRHLEGEIFPRLANFGNRDILNCASILTFKIPTVIFFLLRFVSVRNRVEPTVFRVVVCNQNAVRSISTKRIFHWGGVGKLVLSPLLRLPYFRLHNETR